MSILAVLRLASCLVLLPISPHAEHQTPGAAAEADSNLTPEEKAEHDSRQACKINICAALHDNKAEGGDIACKVPKSWRREQVEKFVSTTSSRRSVWK